MHFNPILIVQADSLEDAKSQAEDFIECECGETSYFDHGSILPDDETEFNKPLSLVKDKIPVDNHVEKAMAFVDKAYKSLTEQSYDSAGYDFEVAGKLLRQLFCTESNVYNIQYYDYSWDYGEGWYAIEGYFRY
jgi:hypothetical protein